MNLHAFSYEYVLDEDAMDVLASHIAGCLHIGDVITLQGDLGSGKTSFARSLIRHWVKNPNLEVLSPTFTIVQLYENQNVTLWHYDLYRIERREELYEMGLDEALHTGITLVEWPEHGQGWFDIPNKLSITLTFHKKLDGEHLRDVSICCFGHWQQTWQNENGFNLHVSRT
jgi:tRNA threonylcarbamoyl adenosine modification protein YjeE